MRAKITLAVANAGFILLMLVSGMVILVSKLPGAMRTAGAATGTRAWVVLAVWAVVGSVLAAKFFRWE
jgi:hypothetical protein